MTVYDDDDDDGELFISILLESISENLHNICFKEFFFILSGS